MPCHEQQITAEKTNRSPSWHSTLPCHEQQSTAEKTKRCPRLLVHSWCIPGALLVHSWCTPGALLVHSWCISGTLHVAKWCTPGALLVHSWCTVMNSRSLVHSNRCPRFLVHSWCTPGALSVHSKGFPKGNFWSLPKGSLDPPFRNVWIAFFAALTNPKGNCTASERKPRSSAQKRLDRLFANLQTRKGIAPLPKGSLDPVAQKRLDRLLANLQTRKGIAPASERKSLILRTETFGSPFRQLANPKREIAPLPKGCLDPPHRNVWIAQEITTFITERGVTTTRPQQNTPQTLPTERSMNGPGAHPAQRAAGTCRCVSTATFILRTAPLALEATAQPGPPPRIRQLGET